MDGVAVLLGIDALMDMARTSINVVGNCLAAAIVARWEGVKFPQSADFTMTSK
jgi:proton glutamate symport protein